MSEPESNQTEKSAAAAGGESTIDVAKLAAWIKRHRDQRHWATADLAREVYNAGYPISANKINRLENYSKHKIKRIDLEFVLWLERVFNEKFLTYADPKQIEVSRVLDLIEALKKDSRYVPQETDERLSKIFQSIKSLLAI